MNRSILRILSATACVAALASCTHTPPEETPTGTNYQDGVYIVHEGGFNSGNASVSYLHSDGDSLINGLYNEVVELPLGDVAQSMNSRGDKAYIVVNNSSKIEVMNLSDFSSAGTINDLGSPRYIEFISDTKAYVTDLFSGTIHIVNPSTMAETGTIAVNGWVEELKLMDGMIYAVGNGGGQLYKINPNTDQIIDSAAVGTQPSSMVVDANGKIWVLASGGWQQDIPNLVRIDPATMTVEADLAFNNTDESPSDLAISPDGMTVYFLNTDLFSMAISATAIPSSALISAGSNGFYRMDVHPTSGEVYISDAIDFAQNGKVYRYNASGSMISTYDVGVVPGGFHFIGD